MLEEKAGERETVCPWQSRTTAMQERKIREAYGFK
jgi:hypothetical protein